jgi:hypothetical protein
MCNMLIDKILDALDAGFKETLILSDDGRSNVSATLSGERVKDSVCSELPLALTHIDSRTMNE